MRLIDAELVLAHVKPYEINDEKWLVTGGTAIRLIHNAIDNAPTIDAVHVVRCPECKWHHDCGTHFCDKLGMDCPDDSEFFCKYGKLKEN